MAATLSDVRPEAGPLTEARWGWGVVVLAVLTFAMVALSWGGLVSLPRAWALDEYSHGWLIPPIALYLFLRRYQTIEPLENPGSRLPGVLLAVFALAVTVLGNLTNIPDVITYGTILWIGGMILLSFGWRYGLRFWPAVVYLVFMLPLPSFLYTQLSVTLQIVSSEIGVLVVRMFGVPVFLEGNVIDLGVYKLLVSEACSGLRYLFPLMSFGFLFGVLYKGPNWHKVVLFLSAAPITILMNSFRIGIIGLLVDRWGISQAEGFLHTFEGWVIFVTGLVLLYLEVLLLKRISRDRRPFADTLDLELVPLKELMLKLVAMPLSRALLVIAVLTTSLAAGSILLPERVRVTVDRESLGTYPLRVGEWSGLSERLSPSVEKVLQADDYLNVDFTSIGVEAPINMFVAYYNSQTNGSGTHSPEVSIPAAGWEVSEWKKLVMQIEGDHGTETVKFNRAVISKGLDRKLVYFWFEQRGRRLDSDYASKVYTVWDSFARGRTDGGLVRFITPLLIGEGEEQADQRLREFVGLNLGELELYLPK